MCGQRAVEADGEAFVGSGDQPDRPAPIVGSIVLVADDNPWTARTAAFLQLEGFGVDIDVTGAAAVDGRARFADAAIVDLGLAALRAIDVCAAWRSASKAPILALTRRRDEASLLEAYAAGADHVAPIDITSRQLLARLRSVLRRVPAPRRPVQEAVDLMPIRLDAERSVATVNGIQIALTRQELAFLGLLVGRAGRVVGRAELSAALQLPAPSERSIDFFVRRLREKLERVDCHRRIVVVRGVGFRYDPSGAPATDASDSAP